MFKFLFFLCLISFTSCQICNKFCDDRDPSAIDENQLRFPVQAELHSRIISLGIIDSDNMVLGRIENGEPQDEIWIDRSFDGSISYEEDKLGQQLIPGGSRQMTTNLYNVDDPQNRKIGALRACGKAEDRDEIACTPWARSTVNAERRSSAAATALMQFYNTETGLWNTTNWWNAANCLTAIIDYSTLIKSNIYDYAINMTFELNKDKEDGNFTNMYIDDTLWWGLAFVIAYDKTGDNKYLEMAKIDADFSYEYRDDVCGGGLWWTTRRDYKNAIPNELFIKLAAALHNRIPGDIKYLSQALEVWEWFQGSGMINEENLINDGLADDCINNGDVTWTYNQGVILGGLVELWKGTNDYNFILEARKIADAVLASDYLTPNGILREPCEDDGCGADGPSFKGVFMRNLGELDRIIPGRPYIQFLNLNEQSVWNFNRNELNQFGLKFAGPIDRIDAARQHSALEVFIAAAPIL